MTEEPDSRVTAAFSAFRDAHRNTVATPAVESVFATARQQRQRHYVAGMAAAASLVLVVGAGVALTSLGGNADQTKPADRPPRAAGSVSPSPSDAPPSPTTGKKDGGATSKPSGPRQLDLRNATVQVPPMSTRDSCPGGELDFDDGSATDSAGCLWRIAAGSVKYANLDGASGEEIVTTLDAGEPNTEFTSGVIGLRVPAGRGTVQAMGYVVTGENSAQFIDSISASRNGVITVGIGDISDDPREPRRQDRSYRWSGSGFTQVGGPTAFPEPGGEPSDPAPSGSPSTGPDNQPDNEPEN